MKWLGTYFEILQQYSEVLMKNMSIALGLLLITLSALAKPMMTPEIQEARKKTKAFLEAEDTVKSGVPAKGTLSIAEDGAIECNAYNFRTTEIMFKSNDKNAYFQLDGNSQNEFFSNYLLLASHSSHYVTLFENQKKGPRFELRLTENTHGV